MDEFQEFANFPGVWTRSIKKIEDSRGYFSETFQIKSLPEKSLLFVQDSMSYSAKNVLRGMHMQIDQWQLITIVEGKVLDVLINLDPNSKNYSDLVSLELNWNGLNQILVSPGIAHGYAVLSDSARIHYKSNVYYGETVQVGIRWDSKILVNLWPNCEWNISDRDKKFLRLEDF